MNATVTANIASYLPIEAIRRPYAHAVVCPSGKDKYGHIKYTHLTFEQLNNESRMFAAGLEKIGIARGMRTVLMVKPSLEFFSLTFALFRMGAVPILIDPGMGIRNLGKCLAESAPEAFIGIPKAHIARLLFGWAKRTLKILVTVGEKGPWGGSSLWSLRQFAHNLGKSWPEVVDSAPDEVAAILFTSGSTGPPKGAVYTHGIFSEQVRILRDTYKIEPGEIDLATFPLFALFGPALGMTAIIPNMDPTRPALVDSSKIIRAVQDFGVTNMFGSPALLDRVGRDGEKWGVKLPSIRRVLSAGAPVRAHVIQRFQQMLGPDVEVFTPYGATEALPVASIGSREILGDTRAKSDAGAGVCVGRPTGSTQIDIIKVTDEPIARWSDELRVAPGTIGEIVVRGPVVTREYFARPEATRLAKIALTEGQVCHRMGDLGYLDAGGRLWFCGRKSHRVMTLEGDLYTIPCEAVFNTHPSVARTALVGVGPKGNARPVLCVELKPEFKRVDRGVLVKELRAIGERHEHTRSVKDFLFHAAFPVDIRHNAKIFREKLAVWAARKLR